MTNFDKWKEKLTPEDFVRVSEQWCGNLPICNGCGNSDGDCRKAFLYWANTEAEGNEE